MTKITTLRELYDALKSIPEARAHPERFNVRWADEAEEIYCRSVGLPRCGCECDWGGLPTFGGDEPRDTAGIWSWDATHVICGESMDDLAIERREDVLVGHHGLTAAD